MVGCTSDKNPYLIFMNDFVIQFYDSEEEVRYLDYHGINDKETYLDYINLNEDNFKVKILDDKFRRHISFEIMQESKVQPLLKTLENGFNHFYKIRYGKSPNQEEINAYKNHIINDCNQEILKYSLQTLVEKTMSYFDQ
jgi:hypothetical protein